MNWTPITNENIRWLLIDFDMTIATNNGHPDYIPSVPIDGAVETLNKLNDDGWKIVIYTARPWADYHNIEKYCELYKIPMRRIICGKPLGKYIIDDKCLEFNGNWKEIEYKIWKQTL